MAKLDPYQRQPEHVRADQAAYARFLEDTLVHQRPAAEALAEYRAALEENFRTYDRTNWGRMMKIRNGV